jgi:cytochrome P450
MKKTVTVGTTRRCPPGGPAARFPIGESIDLDDLVRDPYPIYARLRASEPVTYIPSLNMYFVTRYDDVKAILQDTENFVVGTENSTILDTFGEHMMTVEGDLHDRYKAAHQPFFMPAKVRDALECRIGRHVDELIDEFARKGEVEFRGAFASRLPILTMLSMFGLSLDEEQNLREWYDSFERALSNFTWNETVRAAGRENAGRFIRLIRRYLDSLRSSPHSSGDDSTLLRALVNAPEEERLSDEQICRNALIIFFGGISTVEALILNAIYSLSLHPEALERVRNDVSLIPNAVNETVRWLGPVQSATRHVTGETEFRGVVFRRGDTVNCMLASANHDSAVFEDPASFDIDRRNTQRHIGFAVGPHHCLGSRLARAEARVALERLFFRLPGLRFDIDRVEGPTGYEFRQPTAATAVWDSR